MQVIVNGKNKEIHEAKLTSLLAELNLTGTQLVIEHNGLILGRDQWTDVELKNDDKLELVRFVGGG